jgi:hypothetical protein
MEAGCQSSAQSVRLACHLRLLVRLAGAERQGFEGHHNDCGCCRASGVGHVATLLVPIWAGGLLDVIRRVGFGRVVPIPNVLYGQTLFLLNMKRAKCMILKKILAQLLSN